ncbi:helicase HerA domain-containing protein [Actinoplanes sp. NPDC049316]|uniref:ATP-binding protein n=1 Tax=Actinoplanes sp. NPDC049316 TaxID=3154727 RepID=UPI003423DC40
MMEETERRALNALRFNWAPTPDDVWQRSPYHVEGLHRHVLDLVIDGVEEARKTDESPIGVALLGQRGTGKTHLLGTVREHVQTAGGYFFLIELLEARAFWHSAAISMLDGFARPHADGGTQLDFFLRQLAEVIEAPRPVKRAIIGEYELTRPDLDAFADLIRKHNRQVGIECQDTARALALQACSSLRAQDVGYAFLCSNDEEEAGDRAAWGMRRGKRSAQEIVRDISRLLALTGPSVIAVDQIDVLIAQSVKSTSARDQSDWQVSLLLEQIAGGLMALRESTRRSLSVVACLPLTWQEIRRQATDTVQDRFREAMRLKEIPSAELGRQIIERRFAVKFDDVGFTPPYPSWPVLPAAFDEAIRFTPREMLRVVDRHVRGCLARDQVDELAHLLESVTEPAADSTPAGPTPEPSHFAALDARYAELCASADPGPALDQQTEDQVVPGLLKAGLTAWIAEQGAAGESFSVDPQAGGKPALHARLRCAVESAGENEEHWSFRAVCASHHIAALNRIRNAVTSAGLTEGVSGRRLFLLRTAAWSPGARTKEVVGAFAKAGGRTLPFDPADVARLTALRDLIAGYGEDALRGWFATRRPTTEISLLRSALEAATSAPAAGRSPAPPAGTSTAAVSPVAPAEVPAETASSRRPAAADHLSIGSIIGTDTPVTVDLEALRRHTAVFAGSGSGKTVLIRRLVEECALRGVSAIVLDPNNDLARLGDAWPEPPGAWLPGDAARAAEYLAETDVVIWTPRRQSGRPLSFQPLPEFAEIADDPDALAAGIDAAVAALAPHARADGPTEKARLSQAVLREALTAYAATGASDLRGFIGMLNALPEGVSQLEDAVKLGAKMAQLLTAAMVNDPLFGGTGAPVDPGQLLTPPPGRRARVSVISFVGLPDERQRQTFVNQLQLALFAWIKRNPAGDRPLGGLFVMDEAQMLAPSGAMTPCTQSTLVLASQARKYGLGLVFATQAPKGLHNQIPGNAATQFFGLLTSMTQIDAAQEIARAKGSPISDVGRLGRGQFYAAVEGAEFVKMQAPLCLTHHPKSPLTTEEVIARAAKGDPGGR